MYFFWRMSFDKRLSLNYSKHLFVTYSTNLLYHGHMINFPVNVDKNTQKVIYGCILCIATYISRISTE